MNILFLDDNLERTKRFLSWVPSADTVKEAGELIDLLFEYSEPFKYTKETASKLEDDYIEPKSLDVLFLDHDLSKREKQDPNEYNTGSEVVRWIIKNKPRIKKIIVHSHNKEAAAKMNQDLLDAGYNSIKIPFVFFKQEYINDFIKL